MTPRVLWLLLALFVLRVLGQVLAAFAIAVGHSHRQRLAT
jgi:hypothetical protein